MQALEVVRTAFAEHARTGGPAYSVLHPDVEWINSGAALDVTTFHGHEGVAEWMRSWGEATEEGMFLEAERLDEVAPGRVVALTRMRGRGKASGLDIDLRFYTLFEVRDDKIVRAQGFDSRRAAVEAAEA